MANLDDLKPYEPNEEDINKALNYLRIYDPEHATREEAESFLAFMNITIHEANKFAPESMEDYYDAYKKQRPEN